MNTLDDVHPKLRPLVSAFLMKSKYPYRLEVAGRFLDVREDGSDKNNMYNAGVLFFDRNYTRNLVGSLKLVDKKDGGMTLSVRGRKVVAPRRRSAEDQQSKTSSDEQKVLKLMCQMITPYTLKEISGFYEKRVDESLGPWRRALYSKTRAPYHKLTYETMVKELRNLKDLGVNFITSEFRGMMEETLAYHDENEYRNTVIVEKMFVSIREDGIHTVKDEAILQVYPTFDTLPIDYQGKLAILKMLKDGDSIPEVGIRIDAKTFWVFYMPERIDAGNK
jgi:hypothetical protein